MPSSILASLKRKKSPEQLVKSAVACLHELPPVKDEHWILQSNNDAQPALENLSLNEKNQAEAGSSDQLSTSAQSTTSSQSGSESGSGPSKRPGFFSHLRRSRDPSSSVSSGTGESESGRFRSLSRPHSFMFFSEPSKRIASSPTSPRGKSLMHANSGDFEEGVTVMDQLSKRLFQMKLILYGDGQKETDKDKCTELAQHVIKENLIPILMDHFTSLPFEARKDAAQIFNNICRHDLADFVDHYLADEHFFIVIQLINGYGHPEVALNCGAMLREAIRNEKIARHILFSERIWPFFDTYVHLPNFDVASDSFATLRDLLTRHKSIAAEFLEKEYDQVFTKYKSLLSSENYVTRRMSLKMLGEILLDRTNFNVMIRYISSKDNLKAIMMLLRDKSASIQFEAFHVFKVFVANPKKPQEIIKILVTNREKLVAYLTHFHADRDDEQFREEKSLLISTLSKLEYVEEKNSK